MSDGELPHNYADAFASRNKQISPATLLDKDNKPLARGEALLENDSVKGVFWPERLNTVDIQPFSVASLIHKDSVRVAVKSFRRCSDENSAIHYHFECRCIDICDLG